MDKLSLNAPRVMCFPHISTQSRPPLTFDLASSSTNFYGCHLWSHCSHTSCKCHVLSKSDMHLVKLNKVSLIHAPIDLELRISNREWAKTTFECAAENKLNPISWVTLCSPHVAVLVIARQGKAAAVVRRTFNVLPLQLVGSTICSRPPLPALLQGCQKKVGKTPDAMNLWPINRLWHTSYDVICETQNIEFESC